VPLALQRDGCILEKAKSKHKLEVALGTREVFNQERRMAMSEAYESAEIFGSDQMIQVKIEEQEEEEQEEDSAKFNYNLVHYKAKPSTSAEMPCPEMNIKSVYEGRRARSRRKSSINSGSIKSHNANKVNF
jgi:hypothetical protein